MRTVLGQRTILTAFAGWLALTGCTHLGPKTVAVDRFDYSTAIADSWKQQTLLNIVKLRYMDLPVFVDVSSIVAGYSIEMGVNVKGGVSSGGTGSLGDYIGVGGQALYTDRPTVTYVPLTGEQFLRGLLTPIEPKNIFFMLQSGYPADFVLGLTVEGLNGVHNRSTAGGVVREADPAFVRALQLLREVQLAGAVCMRVEEDRAGDSTAVFFFRGDDVAPDIREKSAEIRRLLKLSPDASKLALTYSPMPGGADELAVNSRSMLQIMSSFSTYVDVPEADLEAHRATPAPAGSGAAEPPGGVRIHSGDEKPLDAFAAVRYRGHWFWVDDGDYATKRALTAVMFFFTLADTGADEQMPLITIPAQ